MEFQVILAQSQIGLKLHKGKSSMEVSMFKDKQVWTLATPPQLKTKKDLECTQYALLNSKQDAAFDLSCGSLNNCFLTF